jgi:UDP-glucuronate 4-epimerase
MSILLTGAAGFIGFHVAERLLGRGKRVIGVDNLNDYYNVKLKEARLARLDGHAGFTFIKLNVADREKMLQMVDSHPDLCDVVHLAAQAGVRHSLRDPYSYIDANVMGTLVVLEAARRIKSLKGMLYASLPSVYGANTKQPLSVEDRVDCPVSLYGASKRACELIAECYASLYDLPLTGLRFFTVYGPWGRPDMAPSLFMYAILAGERIRVSNQGDMARDFTYIDDIVQGVVASIDRPAEPGSHRIYNLGNHRPVRLLDFIAVLEQVTGRTATKEFLPMQPGDVKSSHADIESAQRDLDFQPTTTIEIGLAQFARWYKEYHQITDQRGRVGLNHA